MGIAMITCIICQPPRQFKSLAGYSGHLHYAHKGMVLPAPSACRSERPKSCSVLFCDRFINLSEIARITGLSVSGLSMIFSGKRRPRMGNAVKIAHALGMSTGDFVNALAQRYDYGIANAAPRKSDLVVTNKTQSVA